MGDTILLRRGTAANLPDLQEGEPGFATDTKVLYIGAGAGTAESAAFCTSTDIDAIQYEPNTFTQATIQAALNAIETTNKVTLLLRPGTWVISSNADWSAYTNVTFNIVPGAVISHGAFTVKVPNLDEGGLYQRFSGTGLVTLSGITKIIPQWFGAIGDGSTDDTAAFVSAAASVDASGNMLFLPLPSVGYKITAKISFAKPPNIVGEVPSPPVETGYAQKGVVILSTLATDYAIEINNSVNYIRGLHLENIHLLASGTGTTGYGINIINCGWEGSIKNVTVEGFTKIGVRFSQVQDTLVDQLSIIKCGTDNTYPSLYITGSTSNLIQFNRLRIEFTRYIMLIDSSADSIDFYGAHLENGDYTPAGSYQYIPRYSSIRISAVSNVRFHGGTLIGATLLSTIAEYSIAATDCPYFITVTTGANINFIGTTMGAGWDRSKIIDFTGDGSIIGVKFQFATIEDYSIKLIGNITFIGNNVNLADVPTADGGNAVFSGIYGEGALVKDNWIICVNPGATYDAKTSGYLFGSSAANSMRVGNNIISTTQRKYYHDGNELVWEYSPTEAQEADYTGTVDSRLYDFHKIFIPTVTGALTAFSNPCVNQIFTIRNLVTGGGFNYTVTYNAASLLLKGGVDAVLAKYQFITLMYDAIGGLTHEVSRNF